MYCHGIHSDGQIKPRKISVGIRSGYLPNVRQNDCHCVNPLSLLFNCTLFLSMSKDRQAVQHITMGIVTPSQFSYETVVTDTIISFRQEVNHKDRLLTNTLQVQRQEQPRLRKEEPERWSILTEINWQQCSQGFKNILIGWICMAGRHMTITGFIMVYNKCYKNCV